MVKNSLGSTDIMKHHFSKNDLREERGTYQSCTYFHLVLQNVVYFPVCPEERGNSRNKLCLINQPLPLFWLAFLCKGLSNHAPVVNFQLPALHLHLGIPQASQLKKSKIKLTVAFLKPAHPSDSPVSVTIIIDHQSLLLETSKWTWILPFLVFPLIWSIAKTHRHSIRIYLSPPFPLLPYLAQFLFPNILFRLCNCSPN